MIGFPNPFRWPRILQSGDNMQAHVFEIQDQKPVGSPDGLMQFSASSAYVTIWPNALSVGGARINGAWVQNISANDMEYVYVSDNTYAGDGIIVKRNNIHWITNMELLSMFKFRSAKGAGFCDIVVQFTFQ